MEEPARTAQLERELAEARAQIAAQGSAGLLVEACPDIVVLAHLDGTVIEANDTALRTLGLRRDQFVGRSAYDFFSPEVADGRRAMAAEVARTRRPLHQVDVHGPRVIDHLVVPLFDANGEVDRLAVYSRDVSEQFRTEQEAREQQRHKHEAEKQQALRDLASDVAHEFNNLLTPIVTYLRLAKRDQATRPSSERCPLLDSALDSAERATQLVNRVVDPRGEESDRPASSHDGTHRRPAPAPAPAHDAMRVLAVDDEAGVLQVIEVALLMAGHHVQCFESMQEGYEAFEGASEAFDAAILDHNLRDGTGLELAQRLRAQAPGLLIVLCSGRPTGELRHAAEALHLRLLAKPFSVESLQEALNRA